MKLIFSILGAFSLLILAFACAPVPYATVGQNVPLFHQKGEASFSGGYCETDDAEGAFVQAAGALTNHVAVSSSFYYLSRDAASADSYSGHGSYFEFGAGGFDVLGTKNRFSYEVFGGLGFGNIVNTREATETKVHFLKPYVQPSIGYSSKWFDIAFTPRIVIVSFTNYSHVSPDPEEHEIARMTFEDEKTNIAFEPGITLRTGYKGLKLQIQYNHTTFNPWNFEDAEEKLNVNDSFFSIGLNYMLTSRYKSQ